MTTRDLLELLDELGFEWAYATSSVEMSLRPSLPEISAGLDVQLRIEIPVGRISAKRVAAAQARLAAI